MLGVKQFHVLGILSQMFLPGPNRAVVENRPALVAGSRMRIVTLDAVGASRLSSLAELPQ